ncbi:serine hydrolase [Clostridium gasigenes]|uniref:serine hydrolase domain-containing protein n=1 Tax=Clostridium gasigenes TaxID=94869 RepID=UPI00162356C1|nr:serine hydrolase [Clostridium gasigenes]MBB6625142.1 serine hydrolase [Clostridium gasigenes]
MITNLELNINRLEDFSGTVSVKKQNKILLEKAYGLANFSFNVKNKINTKHGIASGAKLFTAIAICQLVDSGLLSFDTLLKDCLNIKYLNYDDRITIKHLLTHSSGIPDYFEEDDINNVNEFSELYQNPPMCMLKTPKDHLKLFKNNPMEFEPGYKFDYTNAGYILLGLIIEEKSGLEFKEYMGKNIINKLKLSNTGYFSIDKLPEGCSYGYTKDHDGNLKSNIYSIPIVGGPDGGIYINVQDMSKVWNALLNFKLLREATTKELLTPHIHCENDCYYGYGIYIIKKENEIYKYFLMGGDPGAEFMSAVYPQNNVEVIVMCNRDSGANDVAMLVENSLC